MSYFTRRQLRRNIHRVQENFWRFNQARLLLGSSRSPAEAALTNVCQLLTLFLYELFVTVEDLQRSDDGFRQRFYARVLAVLAVDCFEQFGRLLGKQGRKLLTELGASSVARDGLSTAHSQLTKIRDRHEQFLRDVRNNLLAHRTDNAEQQIEWMLALEIPTIMKVSQELIEWVDVANSALIEALSIPEKRRVSKGLTA